ncbi:MAG: molybdopterin-dependent oxidoreductase [Actinomycetota bacterium]|nr:molybdopterin-dependent oxidoreductase [Actinomycetota bacterium]
MSFATDWAAHLELVSLEPPNAGTPLSHQDGRVVPQDHAYVRSNFPIPSRGEDDWAIALSLVREYERTLDDLRAFPAASVTMMLECAGNGRTLMNPVPGGTPWTLGGASMTSFEGVWLRDVLASFEIPSDAVELVFRGADEGVVPEDGHIAYEFSITVDEATTGDAMLAWSMAGTPLSREHGAPIRLVVPGEYAMKSVKWLRSVRSVTEPFVGHFVRKYRYYGDEEVTEAAPVGPIQLRALIASPADSSSVLRGQLMVEGAAWSSASQIVNVSVSGDGGRSWSDADLGEQLTPYAAVPWSCSVVVGPSRAEIVARATDADGRSQPLEPRWNTTGYGNNVVHRVSVDVK